MFKPAKKKINVMSSKLSQKKKKKNKNKIENKILWIFTIRFLLRSQQLGMTYVYLIDGAVMVSAVF